MILKENQGFSRKSRFCKDFAIWTGPGTHPASRREGVGEPRHRPAGPPECPTQVRATVGIDPDGPESLQVTLKRNSEIFARFTFF